MTTTLLDPYQLTLHALALCQMASADQLAAVTGLDPADVETQLEKVAADGAAMSARGRYLITPNGREQLDALYPTAFADLRASDAVGQAMDVFETGVNKQLLSLTTDWQTKQVGSDRVTNDHTDVDYDTAIIDKLARVHEKTGTVLAPLVDADPLVDRFLDRVGVALTRAEGGETDYVSGVRVESVHTVWFQLHEHLLRLTGRERPE